MAAQTYPKVMGVTAPPPPPPPGRCIYLTYRRFRLYLKTKRFPLRYTHLQRRLYRTRITQRRLRFLRLRLITRLLLLRLLLLLVLLLLRFRRRLRRRLLRCLLRFRRNRPRLWRRLRVLNFLILRPDFR